MKTLFNISSLSRLLLMSFISTLIFTSCLPEEKQTTVLNSANETNLVPDFLGITSAQTINANKIKVTWIPSVNTNVVAYNIYDASLFFKPVLLKTVLAPASEITLTGLTTQKYYALLVKAATAKSVKNEDGTTTNEDSNTKYIAAIPYGGILPAVVTGSSTATLPFNDASDSDAVKIYCKTNTNQTYSLIKTVTNVALTQTNLTGLVAGTEYTCRAAIVVGTAEDNNTTTTVFTPIGQATDLVFSSQPTSSSAGVTLPSQPVVVIKDTNGNTVTTGPDSTAVVTLNLATSSPSLGTIRGTASVSARAGVATFTGINFQEAGVKILTASKADTSGQVYGSGILTADSNSFTISAGSVSATKSTITITPEVPPNTALVANGNNSYTVNITLKDQYDNPVSGIKPQFASSISGDTLSQPTVNTSVAGVTTGTISSTIADTSAPFRMISISSPAGLSTVKTAAPFIPGSATKLAFTVQPSNSPAGELGMSTVKVAVQDAQGNTVTTGTGSDAAITMTISSNTGGAILTGTATVSAIAGVATFSDLGISKTQTGYKLLASAGSYTPAYSSSFNVTAGTPKKIIITGPAVVASGTCSTAMTIQLQDNGNNPANAIQNTPVTFTGLGSAQMFSSPACSGTALSSTITFTAGTNTKTVYVKDVKAEALNITASDTSNVLTPGTFSFKSASSKITMLAQMPSPATPGTAMTVRAGQCSAVITITSSGDNGVPGPVFTASNLSITGLSATSKIYSDAGCTNEWTDPSAVVFPITTSAPYVLNLYVKDNKSEVLSLSVIDPLGVLSTTSSLQTVTVLPSKINFSGPSTVVAGVCSSAYTVSLKDELGNLVIANANTSLNILGLTSSISGKFYLSSACADTGSNSSVTIPNGSASLLIYFKDTQSETLAISISDPLAKLSTSQTVNIAVSPSALSITAPNPANAKTSQCAGPFTIKTLDGAANVTNAITSITASLSGASFGAFYSTSTCDSTAITSVTFNPGENTKLVYYKSHVPATTLTFTVADAAVPAVLTGSQTNFTLFAAPAWLGTQGSMFDNSGNLLGFRTGVSPTAARVDGPMSPTRLVFDAAKRYLYVSDFNAGRVFKYDTSTTPYTYLGWIGQFSNTGGITSYGAHTSLSSPSSAQCINASINGQVTPGWCLGGLSTQNGTNGSGALAAPFALTLATDNGVEYLYVGSNTGGNGSSINRYVASTGAFAGWIGRIGGAASSSATGNPNSCTAGITVGTSNTPGWCIGGFASAPYQAGDGSFYGIAGLANDGTYLYAVQAGSISRYNLTTGAFAGWTGWVNGVPGGLTAVQLPPSGLAANSFTATCSTTANNTRTPGWCVGGGTNNNDSRNSAGMVGQPADLKIISGFLYVSSNQYRNILKFNASTGAYVSSITANTTYPNQLDFDGTNLIVADGANRILKMDMTGTFQGWIGKVLSTPTSAINAACGTLVPNANTPGWCLGGSPKAGMDEQSFNYLTGLALDSNGDILTAQSSTGNNNGIAVIKKFSGSTGLYQGTLSFTSNSPSTWSNDGSSFAQMQGHDDNSLSSPSSVIKDGNFLYVSDTLNSRVKKIDANTGAVAGWIGGTMSSMTGGDDSASCIAATPFSASPGWCKGALPQPYTLWTTINSTTDGLLYMPAGLATDTNYLYVVDMGTHRILKFFKSSGIYVGWIGWITTSPTGGDPGCSGASPGTFTPGWCKGGMGTNGTGNGAMWNPVGIVELGGFLYVTDTQNYRVSKYNSTTGAYGGSIGRTNAAPTTCDLSPLTYSNGSVTVTNGWCRGGTMQASGNDRGGGFNFAAGNYISGGITTDGTSLYVANLYNRRIDKFNTNGTFVSAAPYSPGTYTNSWALYTNAAATLANFANGGNGASHFTFGVWNDGTNMYVTGGDSRIIKMNLSTGAVIGWRGAIQAGNSPSAGASDPGQTLTCSGATIVTPGWCQNGGNTVGFLMGQFQNPGGITGDANFIYVIDNTLNRVIRLPK